MFTTDNGGPASGFNQNAASNWPLKGVSNWRKTGNTTPPNESLAFEKSGYIFETLNACELINLK